MLGLRKEERPVAIVAAIVFAALNGLLVYARFDTFTRGAHVGFWSVFYNHLGMSGYDVFSLIFISCMRLHWNALRHPLFVLVLLPLYWIDQALMPPTEFNFAPLLMAALLVAADVWGAVLLCRTLRDVVGLGLADARWLTAMFYGFAHVMVATMVPDHFALSLPLLMLTMLMAGRKMLRGQPLGAWTAALLYTATAGMTLTNGAKVALAAWFANGRRMFRPRMLMAFALPTLLLGAVYVCTQHWIIEPQERGIKRIEAAVQKKDPQRMERIKKHDAFVRQQNGEAMTKDVPLLEWSDISTPRWPSVVHNLLGESLQLHRDHLMEDVQQTRPVFVGYRSPVNYAVESVIALLLVAGAWVARRERFFQMVASWVALDMVMHLGFGFGLNEVYIMTAHWAFVIPMAIGYTLRHMYADGMTSTPLRTLRLTVAALTVWLWAYNGTIIAEYLCAYSIS